MHEAFKRESDLLKSGRTGLHSGSGGQSFWRPWLPVTSAQFYVFHHRVNKILKLQRISRDQIVFLINARRTAAESGLCKVHSRGRRGIVKSCFLSLFTPRLIRYLSDLIR